MLTVFCILGHWAFVYYNYCPGLSRINTLTLNDTVERVSNYTGLDDCSVFTGLFYSENNKIRPKSRSVFGVDRPRFVKFFETKYNKKKFGTTEIVRFRQVFGFIRVQFGQV